MEPLTPYLIDQLERRATPLFMPFWRGAEIPTVVARDGLWKTLIQGLKCAEIFLYDSGIYEEDIPELAANVPEYAHRYERLTGRQVQRGRYQLDGPAVVAMASDLAARRLFRLPSLVVVIEDYYYYDQDMRYLILAAQTDKHIVMHVALTLMVQGERVFEVLPALITLDLQGDLTEYRLDTFPEMVGSPHEALVREYLDRKTPEVMRMVGATAFSVKKFVCMLATQGVVIEPQPRPPRRAVGRASKLLRPTIKIVRVPFTYEVGPRGQQVRVDDGTSRTKRRAHWVRGHIRGRNCWPEERWVWIRPHFRGTGTSIEPTHTEIKSRPVAVEGV